MLVFKGVKCDTNTDDMSSKLMVLDISHLKRKGSLTIIEVKQVKCFPTGGGG